MSGLCTLWRLRTGHSCKESETERRCNSKMTGTGVKGQGSVILYLTSQAALLRYLQAPRYLKPPLELLTVSSNRPTIISPDSEISQHARRPAVISPGSVISQTAPL